MLLAKIQFEKTRANQDEIDRLAPPRKTLRMNAGDGGYDYPFNPPDSMGNRYCHSFYCGASGYIFVVLAKDKG